MKRRLAGPSASGFSLIELLVTLALVGIVSMTALPLNEVVTTRMKEAELRQALRTLRGALDAYRASVDAGQIPLTAGESGYPPSLSVLVQGVEVSARGAVTLAGQPATKRLVFLRSIPRDPFQPDPALPPEQAWATRAYASPYDAPQPGADVFDVASTSARIGLNGILYKKW